MRVRRGDVVLAVSVAALVGVLGGRGTAANRPRFARPLRTIVVAHLPDAVRTFARVDVSRLRCGKPCGVATHVVTSLASRARIGASLERVGSRATKRGFDARWLVMVTDANGETTTVACDRFGRAGTIDGRAVAFSKTAPFLAALRRELPAHER